LEANKKIWISGCIPIIEMWVYGNLTIIAGIAIGVAIAQVNRHYIASLEHRNHSLNSASLTAIRHFPGKNARRSDSTPKVAVDALMMSSITDY